MTGNSAAAPPIKPNERVPATVVATLRPYWVGGDKYGYLYDVIVGGETIVSHVHAPEHDACRALLARGVTGTLTFVDVAGRPRSSIDIEYGAQWTVIEDDKRGLQLVRFQKWAGSAAVAGVSRETGPTGTGVPPDDNAAHTDDRSTRKQGRSARWESGDEYPHVVLRLEGEGWRIVGCRSDIQWIVQRRAGMSWRNLGFSRTREGVRALLSRNGLDPNIVASFPQMYPEGGRAAAERLVRARPGAEAPPLAPEMPNDESPPPQTAPLAVGKTEAREDRS